MTTTNNGPAVTITPNIVAQTAPTGPGGTSTAFLPYVLAQSGVPAILPSSGSSNASGQITLTTALPYQPVGTVQVYLPAGVVVGDGAGGLKSATFSSTTVCQIVGNPVTANGAYTQSTAAITLATAIVPGGAMGANGQLRVDSQFSMINNANSKTFSKTLGGANVANWSVTTSTSDVREVRIRNRGSQASQITTNWLDFSNNVPALTINSVDTSVAQALTVAAQLSTATDYAILEGYSAWVLPSA